MSLVSSRSATRIRVVVLGYIIRCPLGGMAWHYLNYVVGLARLGHDVYYIESGGESDWSCYDPVRQANTSDPSTGLAFMSKAFGHLGLGDRWAYHDARTGEWLGPLRSRAVDVCRSADVLINVSGANKLEPLQMEVPIRLLIDTDPVFTQIKHLTDPAKREAATRHTHFFTFAENAGSTAMLPDDGFSWRPTRQPVVLDAWPPAPALDGAPFTTVMQWDSYPARRHGGEAYGMKSQSFGEYIDIPSRLEREKFEIALGSDSAPRDLLEQNGWRLRDPLPVTKTPWSYQEYIRASAGEFSVAKHGYVVSQSGWFSERSACYLASGRPVVLQDTGYSQAIPVGEGLLAFSSPEEAVKSVCSVRARYEGHSRAARELAEACFDSGKVLGRMLDAVRPTDPETTVTRRSYRP